MDQTALTLSLRNLAPVPLSLGADKTMSSRVLVGPRIETPRAFPTQLAEAEVVELNQRLRLNSNEELRVAFHPGETSMGWVLDTVSDHATRLRYRALQGFEIDEEGVRRAGAGSADANSSVLQIAPLEDSRIEPLALAQRVLEASEARVPSLLVATRSIITRIGANGERPEDLQPLVEAWIRKFPTLPPVLRAFALVELPNRAEFDPMGFIDMIAFQDPDPMVQRWNLFARVSRADDPTLAKLIASEDEAVRRVAEAQKARIDLGLRTFSSGGIIGAALIGGPKDPAGNPAGNPAGARGAR
jgi:hypothetical protein